jgi:hypothetical protein
MEMATKMLASRTQAKGAGRMLLGTVTSLWNCHYQAAFLYYLELSLSSGFVMATMTESRGQHNNIHSGAGDGIIISTVSLLCDYE